MSLRMGQESFTIIISFLSFLRPLLLLVGHHTLPASTASWRPQGILTYPDVAKLWPPQYTKAVCTFPAGGRDPVKCVCTHPGARIWNDVCRCSGGEANKIIGRNDINNRSNHHTRMNIAGLNFSKNYLCKCYNQPDAKSFTQCGCNTFDHSLHNGTCAFQTQHNVPKQTVKIGVIIPFDFGEEAQMPAYYR